MFRSGKTISFLVMGFLLFGCAASTSRVGQRALKKGNYPQAVALLQKAVQENPSNMSALRDLGIAYFKTGDYSKAIVALKKVHQKMPKDGPTLFYLGAAYQKSGQTPKAIAVYRQFTRLGRFSRVRRVVEAQLHVLLKREMEKPIRGR